MSINRGMDKKKVIHIYDGIVLSPIKNNIMPIAAAWVDLEISTGSQTETNIIGYHLYADSKNMIQMHLFTTEK